jgi:ABC-type phosphate/phosphonate transport system ATPase subunit
VNGYESQDSNCNETLQRKNETSGTKSKYKKSSTKSVCMIDHNELKEYRDVLTNILRSRLLITDVSKSIFTKIPATES